MTRTGTAAEAFSATAERYAESVAPALEPAAREVVRRARLLPGERVLDVGTGTGTAAGAARAEGRRVAGLDAAAGMLEIARRQYPDIEFHEADFTAMPFEDGSFDVVLAVHAVMFADDPVEPMAEMLRVTRPGGRLSASAPGPLERTPPGVFREIYERFGLELPPRTTTEDLLREWARGGGWEGIQTDADPDYHLRLAGDPGLRSWLATGPRAVTAAAWDREKREAFLAAIRDAAEHHSDGSILLPFGALYLTAQRPG